MVLYSSPLNALDILSRFLVFVLGLSRRVEVAAGRARAMTTSLATATALSPSPPPPMIDCAVLTGMSSVNERPALAPITALSRLEARRRAMNPPTREKNIRRLRSSVAGPRPAAVAAAATAMAEADPADAYAPPAAASDSAPSAATNTCRRSSSSSSDLVVSPSPTYFAEADLDREPATLTPGGGSDRVHSTRMCVHPSAAAAFTGTGSRTAASVNVWPRCTTGSPPANTGTAALAFRHHLRSSTSAKGPSSSTGVRQSREVATTLRCTGEFMTRSQRRARLVTPSMTPSTRYETSITGADVGPAVRRAKSRNLPPTMSS
mmetsp:Transcript_36711/g.91431  ORF Transcript_36711/g.91431 Transcript_36711/m.91431 type:complete len:320 (-) Transcript_36711:1236-2195(-)